jgi:hypothetical protein
MPHLDVAGFCLATQLLGLRVSERRAVSRSDTSGWIGWRRIGLYWVDLRQEGPISVYVTTKELAY